MDQTINTPKTSIITRYNLNGKGKASLSHLSFDKVKFGIDGSISGGTLSYQTFTPEKRLVSSTSLNFQTNGKPSSAETQINNKYSDGIFKTVSTDMSSINWTDGSHIHSGAIPINTKHDKKQIKQTSGSLVFDKEKLISGSFTHHSETGVHGYTEVDYSTIQFLGSMIVGGHFSVTTKKPDRSVSSKSRIIFTGKGRVQKIHTTNFAPSSSDVKSKVVSDYTGINFNARNEVHSGDVHYHVSDKDDQQLSRTQVTFKNQVPSQSISHRYKNDNLVQTIVVDFSKAKFTNDNHIVDSSTSVKVYDGDGQIQSSKIVYYDSDGNILKKESQVFEFKDESLVFISPPNPSEEENNYVSEGASILNTDSQQPSKTETIARPDGTIEKTITTIFDKEKPVSTVVKSYDIDGKTVTKTYHINLTNLSSDDSSKQLSGSLSLQKYIVGKTLHSESVVTY